MAITQPQWQIQHDGKLHGPYAAKDIAAWIDAGKIPADALLKREGKTEWETLDEVKAKLAKSRLKATGQAMPVVAPATVSTSPPVEPVADMDEPAGGFMDMIQRVPKGVLFGVGGGVVLILVLGVGVLIGRKGTDEKLQQGGPSAVNTETKSAEKKFAPSSQPVTAITTIADTTSAMKKACDDDLYSRSEEGQKRFVEKLESVIKAIHFRINKEKEKCVDQSAELALDMKSRDIEAMFRLLSDGERKQKICADACVAGTNFPSSWVVYIRNAIADSLLRPTVGDPNSAACKKARYEIEAMAFSTRKISSMDFYGLQGTRLRPIPGVSHGYTLIGNMHTSHMGDDSSPYLNDKLPINKDSGFEADVVVGLSSMDNNVNEPHVSVIIRDLRLIPLNIQKRPSKEDGMKQADSIYPGDFPLLTWDQAANKLLKILN